MAGIIDTARRLLAGTKPTSSADIITALDAARAEVIAARADAERIEAERRSVLVGGDAADLARHRQQRADAADRVDTAEAIVEGLELRLAEAIEAERRAVVMEKVRIANEAVKAAESRLRRYPKLAAEIAEIIGAVAEADRLVAEANADLLPETQPIIGVEAAFREIAEVPARVVSERVVERWCYTSTGIPLPDDLVEIVRVRGHGVGDVVSGPHAAIAIDVELRQFTERTIVPGTPRLWATPLAAAVSLPGLRAGDPAFWDPTTATASPDAILARAKALQEAAKVGRPTPERVTELVPLDEAEPA